MAQRASQSSTELVRDELARVPVGRRCDRRAELAALLRFAGTLHLLPGGRLGVEIEVEHPAVARRAVVSLHEQTAATTAVRLLEPGRGHPRVRFVVSASDVAIADLTAAGVLDESGRPPAGIPARLAARRCCAAAYLRGAFMARGSVASPRRPAHLEVRAPDEQTAASIASVLHGEGVRVRVRRHRGIETVYVKDVSGIGRVLALMGAHRAYLAWEQGLVWKAVTAEANRLANADAANARRIARAAVAQRAAIESLCAAGSLDALPRSLHEIAALRLEHPQASLDELARLCRPPVTKATAANRMRRLVELAGDGAPASR